MLVGKGEAGHRLTRLPWYWSVFAALVATALLLVSAPASEAWANTFDVNQTGDAIDANTGDSICDVDAGTAGNQCSLRAAVQTANALGGSHIIRLPAGTYTLSVAGQGENSAVTGDLDITANITVRSADSSVGTVTIDGGAIDRIFDVRSGGTLTVIGITITNGNPGTNSDGGGIYSLGTLTLIGTTMSANVTTGAGSGGAISVLAGTTSIYNSTITGNTGGSGAGIYVHDTPATLHVFNTTVTLNDAGTHSGGGIFTRGTTSINDSTIHGNLANVGGGVEMVGAASLAMTNVTVSGNTTTNRGGGLTLAADPGETATATLTNVTVSGNSSGGFPGGGFYLTDQGGTLTVNMTNVTLGVNTGGGTPGIFSLSSGTLTVNFANSIFASLCSFSGGTNNDNGGNIRSIGNGCPGSNAATNGLQLAALADNGGFTQTVALGATSDALDIGASCPTTDQRGLTRTLGGTCDAGAYELKTAGNGPPVISAIPNQTIDEDGHSGPIGFQIADSDTAGAAGVTVSVSANTSPAVPSGSITFIGAGTSRALRATPDADKNGSGTVTIQVSDGSATATSPFTLAVNAVNDAPSFTDGGNPTASNEDAGLQTVAGYASSILRGPATATDESGQVLTFTPAFVSNTGGLTFISAPAVDSTTGDLTYRATADSSGTATYNLTLGDGGGTANGGVDTSTVHTFTITVNAVNDVPVNTVPGAAVTTESTPKVFSTGTANAISVTDIDSGTADIQMTLGVTSGTLTLAVGAPTGALTSVTGDGTASLVLTGTTAEITAALEGLIFTPVTGSTTAVTLTVTTNDLGNTGSGGAKQSVDALTIMITAVNDPPVNTVPGAQITPANTALVFSTANSNAISFADPDAGAATSLTVTASLPAGVGVLSPGPTGTAPPLTAVTGSGTNSLQLTGSVTTLNSALQGLTFTPQVNVTGLTTLTVTTNDAGNTGTGGAQQDVDTVQINVGNLSTLAINDPSAVAEGNNGSANSVQFTVTLAPASNLTVSVQYATTNGSATGAASCTGSADYQTTSGTLTFNPTETSKTITVPVCGDTVIESSETFRVDLSTPVNAVISDGQGTGTITDDDLAGTISLTAATASVNENGGSVTLTVQRTGGTASGVSVQFGTGDQTAQAGPDFTTTTGTLTFGAGETSKSVTVPIVNDANSELAETFTVTLANPQGGATLGSPSVATVTIVDTSVPAPALQGQDDTDPSRKNTKESKDVKETQEQQQQRERTNQGNRDDIATEGNVTELHLDATPPYVVIGNRDGAVIVRLQCGDQCPTIKVGDYIEVDGVKQHEQLFDAEQVTVRK